MVKTETDLKKDIKKSLTGLFLGRYLHGISPRVSFDEQYDFALGIRSSPPVTLLRRKEYLLDVLQKTFSGNEMISPEDFLASFYNRFKDESLVLEFKFIEEFGVKRYVEKAEKTILQHQIPYINYVVLLGACVLDLAQREGLVRTHYKEKQPYLVFLPETSENQPLEKRV